MLSGVGEAALSERKKLTVPSPKEVIPRVVRIQAKVVRSRASSVRTWPKVTAGGDALVGFIHTKVGELVDKHQLDLGPMPKQRWRPNSWFVRVVAMSWVTLVWSLSNSACFGLALLHFFVWLRKRGAWTNP